MAETAPLSIRRLVIRAASREQAEAAAASLRAGLSGFAADPAASAAAPRIIRMQLNGTGDPGQAAAAGLRGAMNGGGHGG